jgi:hypothetical protein
MLYRFLPLLIYGIITITFAESATQTDWSGGSGVVGPVIDWGDKFFNSESIYWSGYPGIARIMHTVMEHSVDENYNGAMSVYSEDVNGDGYMDILGAAYFADDITWWENVDGSGTSWTEHTVDGDFEGAMSVYSEDVNGDGYIDILGAAYFADDITWWENVDGSGTSWTEHTVDGDFYGVYSIYSEDVNGDGYMDVLGAAYNFDRIAWWENVDGSGTSWTEHTVDIFYDQANSVHSTDINGDGHMDVLGAAYWADDITWWKNMDGSGTSWTEYTVDGEFDGATSVYSADINGDGCMDILGAAFIAYDITWWENVDGSGTSWTEHTIDEDFWGATSVYSEDLNGDGYMDVLGSPAWAHHLTWWENTDGTGTNWTEHIVARDFEGAWSVFSADVNGDSNMDVLGAAYYADDIAWWDLAGYSPTGSLESSCLYLQNDPGWGLIDWNCTEPVGTSVALQVRASDNSDTMGAWSDTLHSPCSLSGLLAEGDSYFQYKVILQTSDSTMTPTLEDVTVTWNPTGIEEIENYSFGLLPFTPNPSSSPHVEFCLPEEGYARFSVYNLSGRLVSEIVETEYPAGYGILYLNTLNPGIYFCRMITDDFTATQQFVVIE